MSVADTNTTGQGFHLRDVWFVDRCGEGVRLCEGGPGFVFGNLLVVDSTLIHVGDRGADGTEDLGKKRYNEKAGRITVKKDFI